MKELHALVDFENVQPSLEALAKLAPGFTDVWLFHGPHQAKQAQAFAASHERVTLVPRSGKGPNALDFHLSFYLGYVAAKHPDAELVVVANDGGYDPMLAHARMINFRARRVGFKAPVAKKTTMAKPAEPAEPAAAPVAARKTGAKPVPVKKTMAKEVLAKQAAPKPAAPARKVPAKKAVATKSAKVSAQPATVPVPPVQKAPAQKVTTTKVTAKKAPAKKTPAKKAVARKVATKQAPAKKAPVKAALAKEATAPKPKPKAQAKAPSASGSKEFNRLKTGLTKMGDKRPRKLASFLRHVKAILGKDSSDAAVEAAVRELERAKVVHVAGDLVLYS